MKNRSWSGVACCFILFILVFVGYRFLSPNGYLLQGHINPGLLAFIFPGAISSIFSRYGRISNPVFGALLAVVPCLLMHHLWCVTPHSFWQDLALLFGAVFWCALGALCILFLLLRIKRLRPTKIWL